MSSTLPINLKKRFSQSYISFFLDLWQPFSDVIQTGLTWNRHGWCGDKILTISQFRHIWWKSFDIFFMAQIWVSVSNAFALGLTVSTSLLHNI